MISSIKMRMNNRFIWFTFFTLTLRYHVDCGSEIVVNNYEKEVIEGYPIASFNFEYVSEVYTITLWILLGSLAKVAFHLSKKITKIFPESCLLILLGLAVGCLLYGTKLADQKAYVLNSNSFFLILLPPIILEAGYFMPNRPFFDNIGTILLFAIMNTLFNTACIGLTLWAFNFTPFYGGTEFDILQCFVFASLISAVDPVAVIVTFVELHVNDMLYIIVFGESLLNDAVSVVLYRLFSTFTNMGLDNIRAIDPALGCVSFLVVSIGGVLIGVLFGIVACFTTKFTEHTPILEPLIILTYSYLSYLTAEMFSTSGILAITFCGMFMKQYVELNIDKKSNATIEYDIKMLASIMETIIFMFMGLSTISDYHSWNTGFVIVSLVSCSIYRIIGVFLFANIANIWRLQDLKLADMLIMSYGGIRGAVAFALALVLDESKITRKKEFVTATIVIVFFTVFVQGATVGPVVRSLRIKKQEIEEPTMSAKLTNRLTDHVMSAFEDIAGIRGQYALRDRVRAFDYKVLKRLLLREKVKCRDLNLLSKLKKLKESSMNRDESLVLPINLSKTNIINVPTANLSASRLSEISTVPDFRAFNQQESPKFIKDAHIHHLLDTAMLDARRKHRIHKRSQLDEDIRNYTRKALNSVYFHHQKPIYPSQKIIDQEQQKKFNNEKRKNDRNQSNKTSSGIVASIKNVMNFHWAEPQGASQIPDTCGSIPPPWKDQSYNQEIPIKANIPLWALNPNYTLHATTSKSDDPQYAPILQVFSKDSKTTSRPVSPQNLAVPTIKKSRKNKRHKKKT